MARLPRLPRRSSDSAAAMTVLPPLLPLLLPLVVTALACSAAPMTASAALAAPVWSSPRGAVRRGGGGGGRTLGELDEPQLNAQLNAELERYALIMSSSDSAAAGAVTRRITPKSVFIAPSIDGDPCADGYQQDNQGRCMKVLKVNATASWDLLLEKLNSQFGNQPAAPKPSEPTPPPGPPPGPFQLAIPIAGVAPPAAPAPPAASPDQPASSPSGAAETATGPEEVTTTAGPADEETETPAPEEDANLVPEVVMLTSEEQPHIVEHPNAVPAPDPAAQGGAYLVSVEAGLDSVEQPKAPLASSRPQPDRDSNPIINTVNNSPLVTGESLVQEVPGSPTRLSSAELQQLLAAALGTPSTTTSGPEVDKDAVSTSTAAPTPTPASELPTASPLTSSATSASVSDADEAVATTAVPVEVSSSTSTPTIPPPTPSTTSEPLSTASADSSDDSRPSSSNLLRPNLPSPSSRIPLPVIAPDPDAIALRPTLFRSPSANVRFPSIDVTFPTSAGGSGNGVVGGDANRLLVDKPLVFPKDDKASVWWPPLPPAPYWGLEQTRTRPLTYRYWSRMPSRLNGLPSSGGGSSSSSSSQSSSSSSSEGSQALRRTLSHSHLHHHRGGSGSGSGSGSSSSHVHRGSSGTSHRRGREW
ncbi:hypothetical protein ONE63_007777 [Megalurothrips usitatus]|uniref:Flocculation protein FLO11-like n=1 Tax=Megalurothrips usitatus TaxID=439358 RepID=A0AAV7XTM7_9NEOP|nr:hypothetical protein ONE63_007777 [Megalurothrips usitatus]